MPSRAAALALLVAALSGAPLLAAAQRAAAPATIPLSEIRRGMRGYGLTVFQGTLPERFDVEVIGVLRNFMPRQDIILVRCNHPTLEHSGIVGGMSGSPIYLEGKLAGALAYGWRFAKDPIAGITPIQYMLAELERPLRGMPRGLMGAPLARAGTFGTRGRAATARGASSLEVPPWRTGPRWADLFAPPDRYFGRFDPATELSPAVTPFFLSGLSRRARGVLEDLMEPYGLVPLQSGGSGGRVGKRPPSPNAPNPFVPGAGVGVQLMRGDIDGTGIGTITHVTGNRFLAFGHPMFNTGEQYFPVTTTRIHMFLASVQRSFKIGEPVEEVGSLTQDRQSCIAGDVTKRARMIPVQIHMVNRTQNREDTFRVEVAQHRFLTPALTFGATFDAISEGLNDEADAVLQIRGRVAVQGHGTLELVDHAFTEAGATDPGALLQARIFMGVGQILLNRFEEAAIERIDLEVDVRYERNVSEIRAVYVTSDELEAGERVNLHVVLRPLFGADEVRTFPFTVPREAAGRQLEIEVATGSRVDPERAEPDNLQELLDDIAIGYPATSLIVTLKLPGQGVTFPGHVVRALPPSALDTLRPAASSDSGTAFTTTSRIEIPMDRIIWGMEQLRVMVRDVQD
jgi:hypothetical protein